jgi:lipopolysaccharide export system permease protein
MKLKLLDRFIIRTFLSTFFFTIGLFLSISVIFDLTEKVDDFIEKKATLRAIIFEYYLNFIPYFGNLFSPLFIFIAVIYFTSRLAYRSEIVAILSAGISFNRLLRPYLVAATLLAIGSFFLTGFVLPPANVKRLNFENTYINSAFVNTSQNIHFKLSKTGYAYMQSVSLQDSTGYRITLETIDNNLHLTSKLFAEKMVWQPKSKKWRIENGRIRLNNGSHESLRQFASIDTSLPISPKDFDRPNTDVSFMSNPQINNQITTMRQRGEEGIEFYEEKKYERYAFPFSTLILTLIGVSLSSRKVRGGIGLQIGLGIVISFAYILFMQFSGVLSIKASFPPLLGAWAPNIIFTALALYLAKRAPK